MTIKKNISAAAAALMLIAGSASAVQYNLGDLISGAAVMPQIGDKIFADWGFGVTPMSPNYPPNVPFLTADDVNVEANYSGNDYYLSFSGGFIALNGGAVDYQLYYSVATASGKDLITAIDQSFVLSASGVGGLVSIGESVLDAPQGSEVAHSSVSFVYGVGDFTDPLAEPLTGDQLIIDPAQDKVWVKKDMLLISDRYFGSSVAVTILTQSFHQTVPDGGMTMALLGFALTGVAFLRRSVRR